jgi:hypothetical protein
MAPHLPQPTPLHGRLLIAPAIFHQRNPPCLLHNIDSSVINFALRLAFAGISAAKAAWPNVSQTVPNLPQPPPCMATCRLVLPLFPQKESLNNAINQTSRKLLLLFVHFLIVYRYLCSKGCLAKCVPDRTTTSPTDPPAWPPADWPHPFFKRNLSCHKQNLYFFIVVRSCVTVYRYLCSQGCLAKCVPDGTKPPPTTPPCMATC